MAHNACSWHHFDYNPITPDSACYFENKAYFTKRGLKKRTVLHELYHHLAYSKGMDKPDRIEEKEANSYAREFLKILSEI